LTSAYFYDKIKLLKDSIAQKLSSVLPIPLKYDRPFNGTPLSDLKLVAPSEVSKLLSSMQSKSSPCDFIPTRLLKECITVFSHIIARLANLSFSEGYFPSQFKSAQITPTLKKQGLDPNDPKNLRPISNLSTISKVLERLFLARLASHTTPLLNPLQSAYRSQHSTETALLKVIGDMYTAADSKSATVLVALDLSAAFDTIDHSVLIQRLNNTFGISGPALSWIKSYLSCRSCFVKIGNSFSPSTSLVDGVPQGSVLGPLLFSLFITPLAEVIKQYGLSYHQYADDTQLYVSVNKSNGSNISPKFSQCTSAIHEWLLHNSLTLNPEKTEAIVCGTRPTVNSVRNSVSINVAESIINPSSHVKTLGITIDSQLNFNEHVSNTCRSCYHHIRALRHLRSSLTRENANMIASAIVGSRLDYCNSLYYGMSDININKLQRVQNSLARVVVGLRRSEHITPVLADLHWLPIRARITFKIAKMVFKVRSTGRPTYLASMLQQYQPTRHLRSSGRNTLVVPSTTTSYGDRSFNHSAAVTWNSLPESVRNVDTLPTFHSRLKTFLYQQSFIL
jgi:hypothetical protein